MDWFWKQSIGHYFPDSQHKDIVPLLVQIFGLYMCFHDRLDYHAVFIFDSRLPEFLCIIGFSPIETCYYFLSFIVLFHDASVHTACLAMYATSVGSEVAVQFFSRIMVRISCSKTLLDVIVHMPRHYPISGATRIFLKYLANLIWRLQKPSHYLYTPCFCTIFIPYLIFRIST